jgi:hypothetical protein
MENYKFGKGITYEPSFMKIDQVIYRVNKGDWSQYKPMSRQTFKDDTQIVSLKDTVHTAQ